MYSITLNFTFATVIAFAVASTKDERYLFVEKVLKRFNYSQLKRKEKGVLLKFLLKVTDYSRQQMTRMAMLNIANQLDVCTVINQHVRQGKRFP